MAQSATLPSASPETREADFPSWAKLLLIVVAAGQVAAALTSFPVLLAGDPDIPGPGIAGLAVTLRLTLAPFVATATLGCAVAGRPRWAIAAMAGLVALDWMHMLPSVATHGLDVAGIGAVTSVRFLLEPVIAVVAALLAFCNERLASAAVVVCLPAFVSVLSVLAFAISVMRHGF